MVVLSRVYYEDIYNLGLLYAYMDSNGMQKMVLLDDLKKYYSYAKYSAKAELKAEVAGSYLNWVWWILEPVCLMFIYAFIFGFVFSAREKYFTAFIYIKLKIIYN